MKKVIRDEVLNEELKIVHEIYEKVKMLSQSANPISKNHGILVLGTLRDLLINIDPDYFEYVLDYE